MRISTIGDAHRSSAAPGCDANGVGTPWTTRAFSARPSRRAGSAGAGFTLLEVLIAIALLAMVAGFLLQMRLDAVRHASAQRRHTQLTQLLRSEAEALRAGAGTIGAATIGSCSTLGDALEQDGFTCEVRAECAFSPAACAAGAGLAAYVIRATGPGAETAEVPLLVRSRPTRWIVAQR